MAKKLAKKSAKKAPAKKTTAKKAPAAGPKFFGAKLKLRVEFEALDQQEWEGTVGKASVTVTENKEEKTGSCSVNLEDADGNPVLYCENEAETAQKACNLCKDEVLKAYKALGVIVNS
jgi:hypothetical protein